jgi:hypothetical protein
MENLQIRGLPQDYVPVNSLSLCEICGKALLEQADLCVGAVLRSPELPQG